MTHYLVSVHRSDDAPPRPEMSSEDMQRSFEAIRALEEDMKREGAWVFSGRLDEPGAATVVSVEDGEVLTTDGPFAEAKEHIAGFYIIQAPDVDAALGWAGRTSEAIGHPVEVWPFHDASQG